LPGSQILQACLRVNVPQRGVPQVFPARFKIDQNRQVGRLRGIEGTNLGFGNLGHETAFVGRTPSASGAWFYRRSDLPNLTPIWKKVKGMWRYQPAKKARSGKCGFAAIYARIARAPEPDAFALACNWPGSPSSPTLDTVIRCLGWVSHRA